LFSTRYPKVWALGGDDGGYFLSNNGISALILLLEALIDYFKREQVRTWHQDKYEEELKRMLVPVFNKFDAFSEKQFDDFRKRRGLGGIGECVREIAGWINAAYPDFSQNVVKSVCKAGEYTDNQLQAYQLLGGIEDTLRAFTVKILSSITGYGGDWKKGVPIDVYTDAVKRQREHYQEEHEELALERFLFFIDLKTIIKENWDSFKSTFQIDPKLNKDKNLKWLDRLNRIRKIVSHYKREVNDVELAFVRDKDDWVRMNCSM
jgi:hypothetical protein